MTNENAAAAQLAQLLAETRAIQRTQFTLISSRRNPAEFGRLERRLEALYRRIDTLRAENGGRS